MSYRPHTFGTATENVLKITQLFSIFLLSALVVHGQITEHKTDAPTPSVATTYFKRLKALKTDLSHWAATHPGESFETRPIQASLEPTEKSLDQIDPGIKFRISASAEDIFLIDSTRTGQAYGCETNRVYQRNVRKKYSEGMVWVLPVESGGALLIISSVAPKRVTFLSIDNRMNMQLIYDSFNGPDKILKNSLSGIDYLCGIQVVNRNRFFLHEGWLPSMSQASLIPRTFVLNTSAENEVSILPVDTFAKAH